MEAIGKKGVHRLTSEPARILIDATEPPVLNEAAAEVLLRILLRAADRRSMTNTTHPNDRPVLSES